VDRFNLILYTVWTILSYIYAKLGFASRLEFGVTRIKNTNLTPLILLVSAIGHEGSIPSPGQTYALCGKVALFCNPA
jgi:hypothetical protein